jgi:phage anti-repressor protein
VKELVKVEDRLIGGEIIHAVNARELHTYLKSEQKFSTWIQKRISDYGFVEGVDFTKLELSANFKMAESGGGIAEIINSQKNEAQLSTGCVDFGQQGRIEYAITIDMAKELSMVERNAKGKEARRYFIDVEKSYRREGPRELKRYVQWLKAREKGKLARKVETDVIQTFIEYATDQGSLNARYYYTNLTKGTYQALFFLEKGGEWKGLRDHLSTLQLTQLSVSEWVAQKYIAEGMDLHMHYKDIYRYAIAKVEEMAAIMGKQLPGEKSNIERLHS